MAPQYKRIYFAIRCKEWKMVNTPKENGIKISSSEADVCLCCPSDNNVTFGGPTSRIDEMLTFTIYFIAI